MMKKIPLLVILSLCACSNEKRPNTSTSALKAPLGTPVSAELTAQPSDESGNYLSPLVKVERSLLLKEPRDNSAGGKEHVGLDISKYKNDEGGFTYHLRFSFSGLEGVSGLPDTNYPNLEAHAEFLLPDLKSSTLYQCTLDTMYGKCVPDYEVESTGLNSNGSPASKKLLRMPNGAVCQVAISSESEILRVANAEETNGGSQLPSAPGVNEDSAKKFGVSAQCKDLGGNVILRIGFTQNGAMLPAL